MISDFIGPTVSVQPPGVDESVWHCQGCNCGDGYPSDEAMAAIAAACTCPGCMTGGKCIDDQPEDRDDEVECMLCPSDCQICSDTPGCDCPTHGGDDA